MNLEQHFLESSISTFRKMKLLAERAMEQLEPGDLAWSPDPETNSIAVVIQHLHGNMLSRWTDFLRSDGEKPWRERDGEFVAREGQTREAILDLWNTGWRCTLQALEGLQPEDVTRTIRIRGEGMTVLEAIHRQVSHYAYHVGQIVTMARIRRGEGWKSLSIPRGRSREYLQVPPPATK